MSSSSTRQPKTNDSIYFGSGEMKTKKKILSLFGFPRVSISLRPPFATVCHFISLLSFSYSPFIDWCGRLIRSLLHNNCRCRKWKSPINWQSFFSILFLFARFVHGDPESKNKKHKMHLNSQFKCHRFRSFGEFHLQFWFRMNANPTLSLSLSLSVYLSHFGFTPRCSGIIRMNDNWQFSVQILVKLQLLKSIRSENKTHWPKVPSICAQEIKFIKSFTSFS